MQKYFLEKVINIGSIVVSVKKRKKKKKGPMCLVILVYRLKHVTRTMRKVTTHEKANLGFKNVSQTLPLPCELVRGPLLPC